MQLTNLTENQVEKTNVPRFLQTMKAIAPGSYEKRFKGVPDEVVMFAMSKAISGLSKQQLDSGLNTMFEQGFCPDPILFRKWCLGIKGFSADVDPIHATYRAKNAALANIEAWLSDDTTSITNAEREAYNRCYKMFSDLKWNYSDKQKFHTYAAFKDFYDEVVKELVAKEIKQHIWQKPITIQQKPATTKRNYPEDETPEQKKASEEAKLAIQKIMDDEGLTYPQAILKFMRESLKK